MVKETPARDWSEGMGAMIGVAMFLGGVAGGLYLTSLYFNNVWGMFIAWIFAMGMGLFDMAHLSKPMRFFRIAARPGSSWISRGFIFVILFIGAAGIQLLINLLTGNPADVTPAEMFFRVVAGILGFGVAIYSGFVIGVVNGVKFWNSGIMPLIYVLAGLAGGAAIMLAIGAFTDLTSFGSIQTFARATLIAYAVAIVLHLWVSVYSSPTAKHSAEELVKGSLAGIFWVVVVLVGIVVPLIFAFLGTADSSALFMLSAAMVLIGSLALRYSILRAGRYSPLIES
jgi:polysulfide reductase chain C